MPIHPPKAKSSSHEDRLVWLEAGLSVHSLLSKHLRVEIARLATRSARLEAALHEAFVLLAIAQGESAANGEQLQSIDHELARFRLPPS